MRIVIELIGTDGVGKTSLARKLALELRTRNHTVDRYHYRHRIAIDAEGSREVKHREPVPPSGRLVSCIRVLRLVRAYTRRSGRVIEVRERYLFDCQVDPSRYGLHRFSRHLLKLMERRRGVVTLRIWLTDNPESIHERKPELSLTEIRKLQERSSRLLKESTVWYFHLDLSNSDLAGDAAVRVLVGLLEDWQNLDAFPLYRGRQIWGSRSLRLRDASVIGPVSSRLGRLKFLTSLLLLKGGSLARLSREKPDSRGAWLIYRRREGQRVLLFRHSSDRDIGEGARGARVFVLNGSWDLLARESYVLRLVGERRATFCTGFRGRIEHPASQLLDAAEVLWEDDDENIDLVGSPRDYGMLVFDFFPRTRTLSLGEVVPVLLEFRTAVPGRLIRHGDFTPWNCFDSNGRTVVIDWDRATTVGVADPEAFLALDFFTYVAGTLHMKKFGHRRSSHLKAELEASWEAFSDGTSLEGLTWRDGLSTLPPSLLSVGYASNLRRLAGV